jgi:hypothetical protein
MKKFLMILVALIGICVSANAIDFCDKIGNRIEFYPEEKGTLFDGGDVQVDVEGTVVLGTFKIQKPASSSQKHFVIEFYDRGKSDKPVFFAKYYRGVTSREGSLQKKAYIEILGVKLEPCKPLKQ